MISPVRIGNAHGFWGDRIEAAAEMLAQDPDLDFLTLDFLAEVSLSILALQRARDAQAGWPLDFVEVLRSIAPYWREGGQCRVVTNAGGLNPAACACACREVLNSGGCGDRIIAVVSGDDVLPHLQGAGDEELFRNLDTGQEISAVRSRLLTANAYLGARPIAEALDRGADLVITGRVADPSLTVGPAAHWFGWSWDDWDRLAGATVAGHLIECGRQLCGGISSDWLDTPGVERMGFPIAEIAADGSCIVTKLRGTGGRVCEQTVKEQLLYEIADPGAYLSPDATVSLLSAELDDRGDDRVAIRAARGKPPPASYKVSATYQDGFRAQGMLTVYGRDAYKKALRAGEAVLAGLAADGVQLRESLVECLGAGACRPQGADPALTQRLTEVVLRMAVADDSREAVERFARALMPLVTSGPQGTTSYAEGRPRVHPLFRFWPCLIERDRVQPHVEMMTVVADNVTPSDDQRGAGCQPAGKREDCQPGGLPANWQTTGNTTDWQSAPRRLGDLAWARSGDKGIHANIGVIARRAEDFPRLCREVTAARVAAYLGIADAGRVVRYAVANLQALNFVIHGILQSPLRADVQGKALGQVLLEMPLETL